MILCPTPDKSGSHAGFFEVPSKVEVTQLLKAWGSGDDKALERLTPVVENELAPPGPPLHG